jgi:hypothetical protein
MFGIVLAMVATILLHFADSPDTYWPFSFPAFTLGTIGMMIIYTDAIAAIFSHNSPSVAGTVGAAFKCALQLAIAVGLAAVSSITTSVNGKTPPMNLLV